MRLFTSKPKPIASQSSFRQYSGMRTISCLEKFSCRSSRRVVERAPLRPRFYSVETHPQVWKERMHESVTVSATSPLFFSPVIRTRTPGTIPSTWFTCSETTCTTTSSAPKPTSTPGCVQKQLTSSRSSTELSLRSSPILWIFRETGQRLCSVKS